jgi:hypothetical protein
MDEDVKATHGCGIRDFANDRNGSIAAITPPMAGMGRNLP